MTQRSTFINRLRGSIYLATQLRGQSSYPRRPLAAVATLLPESCACGQALPLLSLPEGRSDDCDRAQLQARLVQKFYSTFGADGRVIISFVSDLHRTARGKARPVIALQQAAQAERHAA
jgi:hypothetical protein